MLKSVEGIYHDGKVELVEPVPEKAEGRVIVTFLTDATPVNYSKAPAHEERDESIFDFFGKARQLRSAADIDSQVQEERQ